MNKIDEILDRHIKMYNDHYHDNTACDENACANSITKRELCEALVAELGGEEPMIAVRQNSRATLKTLQAGARWRKAVDIKRIKAFLGQEGCE